MGMYDGDNYPGTVQENLILHRDNLYALQQQINQQSSKTGTAGLEERIANLESWQADIDYWVAHVDIGARYFVFVTGTNSAVYMKYYYNGWSGWVNLGGAFTAAPNWSVGWGPVIDVWCRGESPGYNMWHTQIGMNFEFAPYYATLSGHWEDLGGSMGD